MANTRPKELTAQLAFRLTAGEKAALEGLAAKRVQAAREAGYDIDPTLGAYLRHVIRESAKSAGMEVTIAPEAGEAPKKASPKKGGRK